MEKKRRMIATNCAHELRFNDVVENTIFSTTKNCTIVFDVQKFFKSCLNTLIDEHVEDLISLVCQQYEANKTNAKKEFEIHWISDEEQVSENLFIKKLGHDKIEAINSRGEHFNIDPMDVVAITTGTAEDLRFINDTHHLFFTSIGYVELFALRNNRENKSCYITTSNNYVHNVTVYQFTDSCLIVGGVSQYISNNNGYGGSSQSKFEIKYSDIISVAVKEINEAGKLYYETTKRDKWVIRFLESTSLKLV